MAQRTQDTSTLPDMVQSFTIFARYPLRYMDSDWNYWEVALDATPTHDDIIALKALGWEHSDVSGGDFFYDI